jgi:hypothetical protein
VVSLVVGFRGVKLEAIDLHHEPLLAPQKVDLDPVELDVDLRSRKLSPADQVQ